MESQNKKEPERRAKETAREQGCAPPEDGEAGEQLTVLAASLLDDERFVERYVLENENVTKAVIDKYLRSFSKSAPVAPAGSAVLAPLKRAKTLQEAKQLCEQFLRNS